MRVADAVWQRLAKEVDTVFFLPGGGCGPLVDALGQSGLQAVSCLSEQGAGFAAVAYAQHRGFGVALVTSGPGFTNIMTPLLAAWVDSVPLLVIAGQAMTRWMALDGMRSRGTQEGPTAEMAYSITKMAYTVMDSVVTLEALGWMIDSCKKDRPGPCVLDVPQDVQGAEL